MNPLSLTEKQALLPQLMGFVTPPRLQKLQKVLHFRTRYITIALEDIFQSHNTSAVLRSCECFGIQDVHVIENTNPFDVNPDVVMGATKWLNLHRYNAHENNTEACLQGLKDKGYTLIATTPHKREYYPENLPLDNKIALIFGTEKQGLSPLAKSMADGFMKIPMMGFTESFNISVSVAVALYHLSNRLRTGTGGWALSQNESDDILFDWVCKSVRNPQKLIKHFLASHPSDQPPTV